MPRTKSDAERGYIGAWLRRERTSRGWTPERAVQALRDDTATVIRVDYYRQLEAGTAGKVPGPELLDDFATVYGSRPEPLPEPEPEQPGLSPEADAIVAAIDRLTDAVTLMAGEQTALVRGLVSGLAELVGTPGAGRAARPHANAPR